MQHKFGSRYHLFSGCPAPQPVQRSASNTSTRKCFRQMLTIPDITNDVTEVNVRSGWKLHSLTGDLAGFWSLTVTGNQRLIFRFEDGDAYDLDLVDYH